MNDAAVEIIEVSVGDLDMERADVGAGFQNAAHYSLPRGLSRL
jgi:hypothetical protein